VPVISIVRTMKKLLITALILFGAIGWSMPIFVALTVYGVMSVDLPDGLFSKPAGWGLFSLFVLLIGVHGWLLWRISSSALRDAKEIAGNIGQLQCLLLKLLGCAVGFAFPATALVMFAPLLLWILQRGQ